MIIIQISWYFLEYLLKKSYIFVWEKNVQKNKENGYTIWFNLIFLQKYGENKKFK